LQLPVPGPLIPFFTALSVSSPLLLDYESVSPFLPPVPLATEHRSYVPANNLAGRVPSPNVILDQHRAYLSAVQTAADDAARKTAVLQWPFFLRRIHKQAGAANPAHNDRAHSPLAPLGADPTNPYDRTALSGDAQARILGLTPFHQTGFSVSTRSLNPIVDSRAYIQALLPQSRTIDADPATRATASLSWRQFLGLEDFEYLDEVLRVMTLYCKHLKSSTILGAIPPVGHTAGQHVAVKVALSGNITTRFPQITHAFRIQGRNNQTPSADNSDAAITAVNYSWFTTQGWHDFDDTTAEVHTTASVNRLRGPFFHKLPLVKRSDTVTPSAAYSSIITDYYHMQTIRS